MIYILGWALNYYSFALLSLLGSRWRVFTVATISAMGLVAIFRGAVGTDTVGIYEYMAAHITTYPAEPGFWLMMYTFVQLLESPILAVRAVALVFTLLLLVFALRADKDELLYLMAFFVPVFFYSHSMNGIKVGVAFVILLLALQQWRRNRIRKAAILAVLSVFFHYTALIVLLYLWLTEVNLRSKRSLLITSVGSVLVVAVLAVGVAVEYSYFLRKFNLYIGSGYTSPGIFSGLSEVAVAGSLLLVLPFSRLPRAVMVRIMGLTLLLLLAFWVFSRFSYGGLRLLELITFALPLALLRTYRKYGISFDQRTKLGLVMGGLMGMAGMYRNMLLESAYFDSETPSPFLPYKTFFGE